MEQDIIAVKIKIERVFVNIRRFGNEQPNGGDGQVIERKNAQCSPDKEVFVGVAEGAFAGFDGVPVSDQDAGDEKTTNHEKHHDPNGSVGQPVDAGAGWKPVINNHQRHRNGAERVELGHVAGEFNRWQLDSVSK